jgi:hypothetical protein
VEHEKAGRQHQHVVWLRVDSQTMTAIPDSWDFKKHQATARELEAEFGHERVRDAHEKGPDGKQTERRPKSWEKFRGGKTGIDPDEVKAEITQIWQETRTGKEFQAGLHAQGYTLCEGDRTAYCILDSAGKEHSLARRISGVKTAEIRERLQDIEPGTLPSVSEAREANPQRITQARQKELDKQFAPMRRAMKKTGELEEIGGAQASGSWWERSPQFFRSAAKEYRPPVEDADAANAPKDWRDKIREPAPLTAKKKAPRAKTEKESWQEYVRPARDDREPEISH